MHRHASIRHHPQEQTAGHRSKRYPQCAARQSQHQALRQQLPNQPRTPRSQRLPNRKLASTRRGARQQQIRDVRASDQQHQPHNGHQNLQRLGKHVPKPRETRGHRSQLNMRLVQFPQGFLVQGNAGKSPKDLLVQHIGLSGGLRVAHTRLQPRHQVQRLEQVVVVAIETRRHFLLHRKRNPDVRRFADLSAKKLRRRNAHNRIRRRPEGQLLVEHRRIARQVVRPPRVAHHRRRTSALRPVVILGNRSADHRLHAQHRKVCPRDKLHVHRLRFTAPLNKPVHLIDHAERRRYIGENVIPPLHLAIKRVGVQPAIGKAIADSFIKPIAEQHQLRRFVHRQRFQQHRVHQSEDRRVRTNPKRQRQQGHHRDSRAACHPSQSVVHVLKKILQPLPSPRRPAFLPQHRRIAKSPARRGAGIIRCHARLHLLLAAQFQVQPHLLF